MRKKFICVICLIILLTLCVGTLCACNDNETVDDGSKRLTGLGKIEGLDPFTELAIIKAFYGENYYGQETIDNSRLRNVIATFDDCLVLRFIQSSWSFGSESLYDVYIDDILFVTCCGNDGIQVWENGELSCFFDQEVHAKFNKEQIKYVSERISEIEPDSLTKQINQLESYKKNVSGFLTWVKKDSFTQNDWEIAEQYLEEFKQKVENARLVSEIEEADREIHWKLFLLSNS